MAKQTSAAPPQAEVLKKQQADDDKAGKLSAQQADIANQIRYLEAARRTGWTIDEAEKNMKKLTEEGDFFDDEGRWTLDVAGWPVCLKGWKPDTAEGL